jgi:predicted acetyltransferase
VRIRAAQQADIRDVAELWTRTFPGLRTVEQRMATLETGGVYGGLETVWVAEQSDRLVGAFRGYALTQHFHGAELPMLGLAAVAVDETRRRRGIGRRLCETAIRAGRERGDLVSMLYPFRPSWYEALGWGTVGALHAFRFRPESLRRYTEGGTVRRANAEDASALAAIYERFAAAANGPIRRTQRVWRQMLEGDGVCAFITGDARAAGYAIVRFGRSGSPDDRLMHVRELIADDHRVYEELLSWIAAQRDAWQMVLFDTSPDEQFEHRLHEPRPPGFAMHGHAWAPVARVVRGPMLRLLDVAGALRARVRWGPAAPLRFGLAVQDGIVPENQGEFVVEFDGQRVEVERGSARPLLRLPVAVLAQIYAGELRVQDALMLGRAEHEGDVGVIDGLFRTDRCFRLLDEF